MLCISHSKRPAVQEGFRKLQVRFPRIDIVSMVFDRDKRTLFVRIVLPKGSTIESKFMIGRRHKSEHQLECRGIGIIKDFLRKNY